jgi:hypothetical protein
VIDKPNSVGEGDNIVASFPLTEEQLRTIRTATDVIGPDVRGHAFDLGAMDGIGMSVTFPGSRNVDNVVLRNTWQPELQPLVDAISAVVGNDHAVEFPAQVKKMDEILSRGVARPQSEVMTLAEYQRRVNYMQLPWWCMWPKWMGTKSDSRED